MTALSIWNKGRMHGKTLWHEMNGQNSNDSPLTGTQWIPWHALNYTAAQLPGTSHAALRNGWDLQAHQGTSPSRGVVKDLVTRRMWHAHSCHHMKVHSFQFFHGSKALRFTCPAFWNLIWLCLRNKDWQEQLWRSSLRWQHPWYPSVPYLCRTSWCDTAPSLLYMKKLLYLESRYCIDCEQVKVVPTLTGQGEAMMRALWPQKRRIHTIHTWFKF